MNVLFFFLLHNIMYIQGCTFHWEEVQFLHMMSWYWLLILELRRQTSLSVHLTGSHAVGISPTMEAGTSQIKIKWQTSPSNKPQLHFIVTETVVVKSTCTVHLLMSSLQLGDSVVRQWMLLITTTLCVWLFVSLDDEFIISIGPFPACFTILLKIGH